MLQFRFIFDSIRFSVSFWLRSEQRVCCAHCAKSIWGPNQSKPFDCFVMDFKYWCFQCCCCRLLLLLLFLLRVLLLFITFDLKYSYIFRIFAPTPLPKPNWNWFRRMPRSKKKTIYFFSYTPSLLHAQWAQSIKLQICIDIKVTDYIAHSDHFCGLQLFASINVLYIVDQKYHINRFKLQCVAILCSRLIKKQLISVLAL